MLQPNQIGILAGHIKYVVEKYPPPVYTASTETSLKSESTGMEEWEEELKKLVDADSKLPNYDEIDNMLMEFLIEYYDQD